MRCTWCDRPATHVLTDCQSDPACDEHAATHGASYPTVERMPDPAFSETVDYLRTVVSRGVVRGLISDPYIRRETVGDGS